MAQKRMALRFFQPRPTLVNPLLANLCDGNELPKVLEPTHGFDEASIVDTVGRITGLDQYWAMFSPGVLKDGLKIWAEGTKADGTKVNLFNPSQDNRLSDRRMIWSKEDSYARKGFSSGAYMNSRAIPSQKHS